MSSVIEDDFDIFDILKFLWLKKFIILSVTFIFSLFALIYSLTIEDKYTSEVLYKLSEDDNLPAQSGLSDFGTIIGLNLPTNSEKLNLAISLIKSKKLLKQLLLTPGNKEQIFAYEKFDFTRNQTIYNKNLFEKNTWVRNAGPTTSSEPSYLEVFEKFHQDLNVEVDAKTDFLKISYTHVSPFFAKKLLEEIIYLTNDLARSGDLSKAEAALTFLEKELISSRIQSKKEVISNLIETQMKIKVFANVNEDYLIYPIDVAFIPEKKSYPKRQLMVLTFSLIGFFITLIYLLLYFFLKNNKR